MSSTVQQATTTPPGTSTGTGLGWYRSLPAWARWALNAAIAVLVLAIVQQVSGTDLLTASNTSRLTLKWAMPVLLAGVGGLFSERSGIVNIGLEGMMIFGMWFGAWGTLNFGPWGGILIALIAGAAGGLLHAVLTINFGVDQIISGVAINILGPALTRFLSERIMTGYAGGSETKSPTTKGPGDFTMPFLAGGKIGEWRSPDPLGWLESRDWFWISDIAGMAKGLLLQVQWFTLLGLLLAAAGAFMLWRTRPGLRLRTSGEAPAAGESLGVNVYRYRYLGVVISGALAGLAGGFITLELNGLYQEGSSNGRGFIALAALIFGNWRVSGVIAGAMLFSYPIGFGFADFDLTATRSLLLVVAIALAGVVLWAWTSNRRTDAILAAVMASGLLIWYLAIDAAPKWLKDPMPFALVLVVLIFASQNLRMPRALGVPYQRGST